ncbi:hypothetical protein IT072_14555 [Leifsonia sp. ZF2019]|uniref:hypothetical protein n=1 Tax=Leifsonia sp. ZF2019 TaxID=2781978 RepID=UPI001CBDEC06|nr:hypothetical protein [Leifsonia sp. ZF2019]UAJ78471.1 hypothetical protein IT072_14555 [Leifsonia sp. ZF2019]
MARQRSSLPTTLTGGPFLVHDALGEGLSRSRLRGGDLTRPFRGARLPAGSDGLIERCRAYAQHRRLDFAFSHTTAALFLGVPLPLGLDPAIHVSVPAPGRAPEIAGFVGHKLTDWATVEREGLPITTPAQTWIDLAPLLPLRELVVAGDHLVAERATLCTREELAHRIAASAGRRGIARARRALDRVRPGSESPGETRLRLLLIDAGLPMPDLNREIRDGDVFVARVDLAYPTAKVALEYEGDIHRVDRDVWRKDLRRRERLADLGWRMVRVSGDDIAHPAELLTRVRRLLQE